MIQIPDSLTHLLRKADHVAVLTGAGISAESGVPTFRDAQTGLWAHYDPQELATAAAFRQDPGLVWSWYEWRRALVSRAAPNPGHLALAEMARRLPQFTLITQNVDGLHRQAGSQNVIELHGNLMANRCFDQNHRVIEIADDSEQPPRCPKCNSLLRPDVVWFGESLPEAALTAAFEAARHCDLFFSIGTSTLVQPAASLPVEALNQNIPTVEINPDDTPLTPYATIALRGPAGQILPALLAAAWPEQG